MAIARMHRECGDGSAAELPARKNRLHDLEAVRDAIDAGEELALVHAGMRRPGDAERNLRLEARLDQSPASERVPPPEASGRAVVSYIGPQIGACTPYSSQIVRLVKPIFQPTGRSPRAMRRLVPMAETR